MTVRGICLAAMMGFLAVACAPAPEIENAPTGRAGVANPASVDCVAKGGELKIRSTSAGQIGVCTTRDGRQCEEWALFRDGRCVAPPQD